MIFFRIGFRMHTMFDMILGNWQCFVIFIIFVLRFANLGHCHTMWSMFSSEYPHSHAGFVTMPIRANGEFKLERFALTLFIQTVVHRLCSLRSWKRGLDEFLTKLSKYFLPFSFPCSRNISVGRVFLWRHLEFLLEVCE